VQTVGGAAGGKACRQEMFGNVDIHVCGTEIFDWISEQHNVNCEWIQLAQ